MDLLSPFFLLEMRLLFLSFLDSVLLQRLITSAEEIFVPDRFEIVETFAPERFGDAEAFFFPEVIDVAEAFAPGTTFVVAEAFGPKTTFDDTTTFVPD